MGQKRRERRRQERNAIIYNVYCPDWTVTEIDPEREAIKRKTQKLVWNAERNTKHIRTF
jgi:hypothetical protein